MCNKSSLVLVILVLLETAVQVSAVANSLADNDSQRPSDRLYCGKPSPASHQRVRRVIGGTEATAHAWPWQVLILNGSSLYCSGSILSPTWLITAAHCVDKTYNMVIYVGKHSLSETSKHEQKLEIEKNYSHQNYKRGNSEFPGDNDIALIKLKRPIQFTPYVHAICLPDQHTHFAPHKECTLSGWGVTNVTTRVTSDTLRQVKLPLVPQKVCNSNESYGGRINRRYFCAGVREGGKDGCFKDSGGPLGCGNAENTWYLAGMVSWGDGCAKPNKYGVFLNITEMIGFITASVKDFPRVYVATSTTTQNKGEHDDRKERLFIVIICVLAVIIVILLVTLFVVKFYMKGHVCGTTTIDDGRRRPMSKSELIDKNGATIINKEVEV